MAIVFDAVSYSAPGFVGNTTFAHTVSAVLDNPVLFVHINIVAAGPPVVTDVTYGGQLLAQLDSQSFIDAGLPQRQEVWYLFAPPTEANNVIVNCGNGELTVTAISWAGASDLGVQTKAASNSANAISTIVTSEADELVVDFCSVKNINAAYNVGALQTARSSLQSNEVANSNRHRDRSSDEPGAAAITMSWDGWAAKACGIIAVPLKPVAEAISRQIEYTLDAWDPEQRIFDSNGHVVPRYKIKPNNWCRIVGLESTTAEVYASNYDDPTLVFFESVSYDGETDEAQIVTNRGDLPEVIMARLASGSTG